MKILWLTTTHMGMESIINSLKKVLWLNVSSMNQEPAVTGLERLSQHEGFDFSAYRYDEGKEAQFHYDGEVDHNIVRKVKEIQPQVIIFSGPADGKCKPRNETLLSLRERAKTIGYVLDGGCPDWHPFLREYKDQNIFDLTVNTDGNPSWPKREKDLTVWQPVDEAFYDQLPRKDIRFGFAGGAGSKHRQDGLRVLTEHAGLIIAERSELWGTYNKFAEFMLRTQITVNFPETGSGKSFHLKNRVLEAGFAGCCLLERANPITESFFTPGVDYIEYDSIDQAIDIVQRLKSDEIEEYAVNLNRKAHERYTSPILWRKILKSVVN